MSKYNAHKITADGITFDSKDEYHYYELLKRKRAAGEIDNFELQPRYTLQESFRIEGKLVRAITYTPDFLIYHLDGSLEAVDVKSLGTATQQGELRKKLFMYRYPGIRLTWICRNLRHGDHDGWIVYEELKKRRKGK